MKSPIQGEHRQKYFHYFVCLIMLCGSSGFAQSVNSFPRRFDALHTRAEKYDALMRANHWNEGTMQPDVIFPPVGQETPIVGSQEDCAFHTGAYLAALSFRYAVAPDPQVRQWADETMEGVLKLERVTGQPGCLARSFNRTAQPNPHEKWFFFPQEWHESTSMPGYRWEGDLSSDQITGIIYGVSLYWEHCADEAHKKIASEFLDRLVGRCVDNNFRIVDVDNKMTLWGNFCPDLPHENLNSLLMLSHLLSAHHVTGKARYKEAYRFLVDKHHYDDQAILAKVIWPVDHRNTSDDRLSALALFNLMRLEKDPSLFQKYQMSLNRHWFLWKKHDEPYPTMLFHLMTGRKDLGSDARTVLYKSFPAKRRHHSIRVQREDDEDKFQRIRVKSEGSACWYLNDYWFGRYYKFIDAKW